MNQAVENIIELTRHCSKCNEYKSFDKFYNRKINPNGKYPCKACQSKAQTEHRARIDPEVLREREVEYRKRHKENNPDYVANNSYKYKLTSKKCKDAAHKKNPDKRRDSNYKQKYGLTLEDVKAMLSNQSGLCANRGCGEEVVIGEKGRNKACVDHCHATGKVRAILCLTCNTSLGLLENKNRMLGLTEYLQKFGSK